jgi:hypothetical protein
VATWSPVQGVSALVPGVKQPWRGVDLPTPSSAEVNRIELYLYPTSGPAWPVVGWSLPLTFLHREQAAGNAVGTATAPQVGRYGFAKLYGGRRCLFSPNRPGWRRNPHSLLLNWYRVCSPGEKRLGREVNQPRPSSWVKNEWSCTFSSPIRLYDVDSYRFLSTFTKKICISKRHSGYCSSVDKMAGLQDGRPKNLASIPGRSATQVLGPTLLPS